MIGRIEGNSLVLMTRASPQILALLPSLEGRRIWLKGGGLQVENTSHNVDTLLSSLPDLEIEGIAPPAPAVFDVAAADRPAFALKREPDPHQLTALERCATNRHFGLFMEQGTGKTKVAIDRACQLFCEGQITGVLVVTKKGVHRQWIESELPKDHGPPYVADWWRKKPLPAALTAKDETLKWWSINYDALRSKPAMEACVAFCRAHSGKLLIVADESHSIKTHTSTRYKQMSTLKAFSSHRLCLTGTPIAKDLTDEWSQLKWLDERILGSRYISTFRSQHCIMGGYEGRSVIGQKNLDEFKAKTAPYTYRVTKEQIGYIPKRYSEWVYDLSAEQKRLIAQVRKELVARLEGGEEIPINSATVVFGKIQQIANGFIIDENQSVIMIHEPSSNPRAMAAVEWLDANEGKVVVWCRFTADRAILASVMESEGVRFVQYRGSDAERHAAKVEFLEDPDTRVFLANPQSAGTGLDGLQTVCSQALYYSNSFNAIDRWQSEDRIDRRGMIGGSVYTDLIGKGSIDRYILNNLRKKKGVSSITLGDLDSIFDHW